MGMFRELARLNIKYELCATCRSCKEYNSRMKNQNYYMVHHELLRKKIKMRATKFRRFLSEPTILTLLQL